MIGLINLIYPLNDFPEETEEYHIYEYTTSKVDFCKKLLCVYYSLSSYIVILYLNIVNITK